VIRHAAGMRELTRANYAARWAEKTRPYDGVAELLDALTTCGIRMAVFSNKRTSSRSFASSVCWPVGVSRSCWSPPDVAEEARSGGARLIARRLQLETTEIVYLGDTDTDMQTAVAAGMFPVGALWGFRTAEELTAHGARTLIQKPLELLRILDTTPPQ